MGSQVLQGAKTAIHKINSLTSEDFASGSRTGVDILVVGGFSAESLLDGDFSTADDFLSGGMALERVHSIHGEMRDGL